ncbi:MAG: DNA alkylation repair protein [Anaerolineae bacterium]
MATLDEVMARLRAQARPGELDGMARFGMTPERRLGLSVPTMRQIAKDIGTDHALALQLWDTGIPDAQMVAAMIDNPRAVTDAQMEAWVADFNSWDVCDQVCGNLFEKTPFVWQKIYAWAARDEEYVRRAAFAMIAGLAWHDKTAADERFIATFPLMAAAATDERNFVKKAVNWALRNVGKRNPRLNVAAIAAARDIQRLDSRAARWIAADALRELQSDAVQARLSNARS